MAVRNAFYAQSGGVTAVINATACGLIETARRFPLQIGTVLAGRDGIVGALAEELFDTAALTDEQVAALHHRPGGVFGSSRYPLADRFADRVKYQRLLDVLAAHDVGYFFYNGGNGSMETVREVAAFAQEAGYPLTCIGLPKTIDNDLLHTDSSPGFGSAAKYVATSVREIALDMQSMCRTSTQVYVLEVMGRHAGWLAAASGLAARSAAEGPHLILFPEIAFDERAFLARVRACVGAYGFCVVVAAEGVCSPLPGSEISCRIGDVHSHGKPGQVGAALSALVLRELGYKYHWGLMDYLQRSAGHLVSATDQAQAYVLGQQAVEMALAGKQAVMPAIRRLPGTDYRWDVVAVPLADVAGCERRMPRDFIDETGFHITPACRAYLQPLLEGESWPPFREGLPDYAAVALPLCPQRLPSYCP